MKKKATQRNKKRPSAKSLDLTYVLDDNGNPIPENDSTKWSEWFRQSNRQIKVTRFGKYRVSTVFLGIDASLGRTKVPLLYETMAFMETTQNRKKEIISLDRYFARYTTRDEALQGHTQIDTTLKAAIKKKQALQ